MQENNPYLSNDEGRLTVTPEGEAYLSNVVTNASGQVYAFNGEMSPVMVAAGMARLSRRSGDMRITLLDEFALSEGAAAEGLIERVVTQYGDDSVQQLISIQLVVEGASNILTKLLEWGRLASYLEQSTRYIYFDQPGPDGRYLYYIPPNLSEGQDEYVRIMDLLFATYSKMVRNLTEYVRSTNPEDGPGKRQAWLNSTRAAACDAIRSVLPVATKSTVGIVGSAQSIESLVIHLLSEPLHEAQEVGRMILEEVRKVAPSFFRRADQPERGGAITAYRAITRDTMRQLAIQYLDQSQSLTPSGEVRLIGYSPLNELSLVPDMLFESATISREAIALQTSRWTKARQIEVFEAYMGQRLNRRHRPGRALEIPHFHWEFDGRDYGTFRDLHRHRLVDAMEWQRLTPLYGFEIPKLVQDAGLEEPFRQCFELSGQLYQQLWQAGHEVEAQYATLLGHNMRYRFMCNLRQLFHLIELRTQPAGHAGYRRICNQMFTELQSVYSLSATAMKFVNQGEDEALVRMAAESATHFKLQQMGA